MPRAWDGDPRGRASRKPAVVLMTVASAVALEVRAVEESDVRTGRERDLENVASLAIPKVGVEKGHATSFV